MLCTGKIIREGQLNGAHTRARGARAWGPDTRAVRSNHHVRGVGGQQTGAVAEQQGETPGTEVGEAAGQVGRLYKLI